MFSKTIIINIILALLIIFLGIRIYGVWSKGDEAFTGTEVTENQEQRVETEVVRKRVVKRMMPPESSYNVVVDKVLFFPKRVVAEAKKLEALIEPEVKPEVKPAKITEQMIALLGIVIMGKEKQALLKSQHMEEHEKNGKWVKIGDKVNNYMVVDILQDKVLFKEGDQIYEVLIHRKDERSDSRINIQFKGKSKPDEKI
ncbi:MAG: hypothetical protein KAI40_03605 [Desulfobacterales bacterium]|nr:hypothetical protein [Desulfobacterales bacterium]